MCRQLMHESRVLPALAAVASSPSLGAGDAVLANEIRLVASTAIGRLVAVQGPLAREDLETTVQYMLAVSAVPGCTEHMASAMWCLCRLEGNR